MVEKVKRLALLAIILAGLFFASSIAVAINIEPAERPEQPIVDRPSYVDPSMIDMSPPVKYDVTKRFLGNKEGVLDSYLIEKLDEYEMNDQLEVIIQFWGEVKDEDLRALNELEFDVPKVYEIIPGVRAIGTKESILKLQDYHRTFWVEYNERLVYMMDGTTTVINATKTWSSIYIDNQGQVEKDTNGYAGIDGKGIVAVVLDSGIDAGHPDFDYGEKVIKNLKSDSGDGPWYEMENGDTSSGHGTHCAGTVAGNGDASAGAKAGVAPAANLIGMSTGEAFFITGAVGALEWVYQHSRPDNNFHGPNAYPIRVVSNSWGAGGGEYDPSDSISVASEKLVYENNVLVVFAAGNSGGDGSDIQCSNYGNVPANICVAALEHDGGGIASFSSRGQADLNGTWPDVGSPGVKIMSTAARRTLISAMLKQSNPTDFDPYYFAISGTSMATPHISGICALMWQANPYMKTSYVHDDYNSDKVPDFYNMTNTYVHEAELILEAAAEWIPPAGENGVPNPAEIPNNNTIGWTGKNYDFGQGYGNVMVDRAVGIALALKELRTVDKDRDGYPDFPNATVKMAYQHYENGMVFTNTTEETDTLVASWEGEWTRFTNETVQPYPYTTEQAKMMYIPEEAKTLILTLEYSSVELASPSLNMLNLVADLNGDGSNDWVQGGGTDDTKRTEISLDSGSWSSAKGNSVVINVEGMAKNFPIIHYFQGTQFYEVRVDYTVTAQLIMESSNASIEYTTMDYHAGYAQFEPGTPSPGYNGGTLVFNTYAYDMRLVYPTPEEEPAPPPDNEFPWIILIILLIIVVLALAAIGYVVYRKQFAKKTDG